MEEPQAAFYQWAEELVSGSHGKEAFVNKIPNLAKASQKVLVCDLGGGTCDFNLFDLGLTKSAGENFPLDIKRIAVSRHILLGGDNLDLKIASLFEESYQLKFSKKLSSHAWAQVLARVRHIKESVLEQKTVTDEAVHLSLASQSRNLFTGSETITVPRKKIHHELLEGFFPFAPKKP